MRLAILKEALAKCTVSFSFNFKHLDSDKQACCYLSTEYTCKCILYISKRTNNTVKGNVRRLFCSEAEKG